MSERKKIGRPEGAAGDVAEQLRRGARKVTGPRAAILRVLRQNCHPMTTKDIQAALASERCDLATVYRSMHLLEEMQLVKRYDFGDGVARFELVQGNRHHHHLICTECAGVVEVEECSVRELERELASRNGFKSVTHKLEFFGVCPQCQ